MDEKKPYRGPNRNFLQRVGLSPPPAELAGTADHPVWMHPIEFAQVIAALWAVAPRRFLEWGCGGSSRAWLENLPSLERLVSVEHNAAWARKVRSEITDDRFTLLERPPLDSDPEPPYPASDDAGREAHRLWAERCETDRSILAAYIDAPDEFPEPFDAALVDGRARNPCMEKAYQVVRPGGLIILHDAQRLQYHDTVRSLGEHRFLEPFGQGQVCLIRRAS